MQRFVGSVMIVAATTWAGILYGKEQQNGLNQMYYLRHLIQMLKGELEYSGAPLGEICCRIAVRVKEPYRSWMHYMQNAAEKRSEEEFRKIWCAGIEKYLGELRLKKEHRRQLMEVGDYIGKMDRVSEGHSLQLYLENMDQEIKKLREEMKDKKRISSCIGIMSGLFLVIILS